MSGGDRQRMAVHVRKVKGRQRHRELVRYLFMQTRYVIEAIDAIASFRLKS